MTRINSTGTSGPQQIPSQDGDNQRVSKPETQKTQQEPSAAEQQQGKQAAQGRKNEMNLQGNLKQSELVQFHGPGHKHRKHAMPKDPKQPEDAKKAGDATHEATKRGSELEVMERQQNQLTEMIKAFEEEKKHPGLYDGLGVLETKDSKQRAEERAAKEIVETLIPKKESNSSKKTE